MEKKPLSFWEIVTLNFGFLGIQFGWGLQMANMSGIYKFLGADTSHLAVLWLAAPVTGIVIQPILGQLSDLTWMRSLGRRRPYILGGAIAATLALILMPNSTSIWMAAILLWLLDGSVNAAMQPYRALVADVAPDNQHTKAFAIQTCLVGIGATLATALPWIFLHVFHISDHAAPGHVPLTIALSFYIGAAVFLGTNLWTAFKSKEYPPENIDSFIQNRKEFDLVKFFTNIVTDFISMPKIMREIAVVQFFTWAGWFCMNTYFALGVAQNVYGLPIGADAARSVVFSGLLEKGIVLGGLLFSVYTMVSFVYAYYLPHISKRITRKGTHIGSLLCGALGLISANFIHSGWGLVFSMAGVGIAWASIVTIPYAMLAGALPQDKMGLYMGLFNITVTLPQIIASVSLGIIVAFVFKNHAMGAVALGGVLYGLGALFTFFIHDSKIEEMV